MKIDPWELLLHHNYAGTPGVIFDQSPGRKSHGRAVNLSEGDFLRDGATSGSGAIAFRPDSAVKVAPATPWNKLTALRCEIVCSCDTVGGGGMLLDAGTLRISVDGGTPTVEHETAAGIFGMSFGPVFSSGEPAIPYNQWVTLDFFYDGLAGDSAFRFDGTKLQSTDSSLVSPLAPTQRVSIGNAAAGGRGWTGRIDDVKVWRLNPHWVDNSFVSRPDDPALRDCWGRWSEALREALKADLECAQHVAELINAAVGKIIDRASNTSPATSAVWQAATEDYRQRWSKGDLDGVAATMGDVIAQIGGDLQLTSDPALRALADDPCVQRLLARLPSLDCDAQFSDLLRKTAQHL